MNKKSSKNLNNDVSWKENFEKFPPIDAINVPLISTEMAAFYLCRKPQTLRCWAMTEKVIKPIRINGRLAWPLKDVKKVLGVES